MRRAARERGSSAAGGAASKTPNQLLRLVGRIVLWCTVAVLLLRGIDDVLAVDNGAARSGASVGASAKAWPDDEARAFAIRFARAYLSYSPRDPRRHTREVLALASPDLAASMLPRFARRGPRQAVEGVVVARVSTVDRRHALVTVAATVTAPRASTRYLTVPVGRDERGDLTVYDLPSFAAPPPHGQPAVPELNELLGRERAEIEDVLTRFFRAFLAGREDELKYLVPPSIRTGALGETHELVRLDSVALLRPADGRERSLVVGLRARDTRTRAVYPLRYRVRLLRRDRWYVAAINTNEKER